MKWVIDIARAAPIRLLWLIAGWLPVRGATALGVFFGVAFGPLHPKHRKVVGNFRIALKSASDREVGAIARQSWRNAGAVFAELPHVKEIAASRVEMDVAREVMVLVEARVPILFLAAHIANWEILPFVISKLCGCATCVYTPEDNHYIARKVQSFREHPHCEFVTKTHAASRMLRATKNRGSIAVMADIRVDTGAMLPLFGIDTSTSVTPARVALRAGYPIVPLYVQRLPQTRFRVHAGVPIEAAAGLDERAAAIDVTRKFNTLLEGWILDNPRDWFAAKRRWPNTAFS